MKVGDKVICIDDSIGTVVPIRPLKKGDVYTLSYVGKRVDGRVMVLIKEVDTMGRCYGSRFRKVKPKSITKQLAESFIEEDSKVREQEHEKVFSLTREF